MTQMQCIHMMPSLMRTLTSKDNKIFGLALNENLINLKSTLSFIRIKKIYKKKQLYKHILSSRHIRLLNVKFLMHGHGCFFMQTQLEPYRTILVKIRKSHQNRAYINFVIKYILPYYLQIIYTENVLILLMMLFTKNFIFNRYSDTFYNSSQCCIIFADKIKLDEWAYIQ